MSFFIALQGEESCLQNLDECALWLKAVLTRAEISEEKIAAFIEVESRYSEVESLIAKMEELLAKETKEPGRSEKESKLLQLKEDWQALKMKAGSELESKQVVFAGVLAELKTWISEARDRCLGMTAFASVQELQEALRVCADVRSGLTEKKTKLEDAILKGRELITEGEEENGGSKDGVEAQLDDVKSQWDNLEEDLGMRESLLGDAFKQIQALECDFAKMQSAVAEVETKLHNLTTVGGFHTVESELESLLGHVNGLDACEAEIISMEKSTQAVDASCQVLKDGLGNRVSELKEKLANVKQEITSRIQEDQEILNHRNDLAAELLQCHELISKVEMVAGEELKFEQLPLLEEGVMQATEAMDSVDSALASLDIKGEKLFSRLKPSEQNVLQVEINELKSHWSGVKENLERRFANRAAFDQNLKASKQWIEKANEEITRSQIPSGDLSALGDHLARLKNIHDECKSPENVVNVLFTNGKKIVQDASDTEKGIFELQLAELKSSFEDVAERSRVEIDKVEEELNGYCHFLAEYQELTAWIENEKRLQETYPEGEDSSLDVKLEELRSKTRNIDSKEEKIKELSEIAARITNFDIFGKENAKTQLLALQTSYMELKNKVADQVESIQVENDRVKEFQAELQHCKDIVQDLENIVSSESPSYNEVDQLEGYVQELKVKFQDALAQKTAIFQLGEKKDELPLVSEAAENYAEVVNKWKSLLAGFSEKIAEIERRITEEQKLNDSFEEVSSWVENVEKEMEISLASVEAQEVEEVVGQVEKLRTLNTECVSYGELVESLRSKVDDSANQPSKRHAGRLSSLKTSVDVMHKRLAAKLGDVEHCVNDVNDVKERISSCKEWLLQKKELIVANEESIRPGKVEDLEEKLVEFQNWNQEVETVLHDIMQAKEIVGQGVGKVSSALEKSLSKELNSLCDTLMGLQDDSAAKVVELEHCLDEVRENEEQVTRYETLLHQAGKVVQWSKEKPVRLEALTANLEKLRDLQKNLAEKEKEFQSFLKTKENLVIQSGKQERLARAKEDFDDLIEEVPRVLSETEVKIRNYDQCKNELEESLEWLTNAKSFVDSNVTYSLDDSSAEDHLRKLKILQPKLESFGAKLSDIAEKGENMAVIEGEGESKLQEKLHCGKSNLATLRDEVRVKEAHLVTFLKAKENYNACATQCKQSLIELRRSVEEESTCSAIAEKSNAQLELHRKQQEKCQEIEEQIQSLEAAGSQVSSACEDQREPLREKLLKIKNELQALNTEALIKQEQLIAWMAEIGNIHEEVKDNESRVKTIHESLQTCNLKAGDIRVANDALGQLKQTASELDVEKENVQNIVEKAEMVLEKLEPGEKQELEESVRALQQAFNDAEEESKEKVRQAEEHINNIIEFDKQSAHCESLLTIYQAAAPVDLSCTVETLEDQIAKLKRLYGDMESRESHMTALQEKEAKLSGDENAQSGRTTPDRKAGKLQGDWRKLKASVGEKLHELERLAEMKKDFEDDYGTCLEGVQELETALHVTEGDRGPVDARLKRMQELCSKMKSYRNKLDLLTDRCNELPIVAYEQTDLDPKRKLDTVVGKWEEVKEDALGKLNELEKEKTEKQNIDNEISKLRSWVKDTCVPFVHKDIPPVIQKDMLEKAVMDNNGFLSILDTKFALLGELLSKTRNIKGGGQQQEKLIESLRDIERNLKDAKAKLVSNSVEIKNRLQQHGKLVSDLHRVRDLLAEFKRGESLESAGLESDNWIEESISSRRIDLAKLESCVMLLSSVAEKTAIAKAGHVDVDESSIGQDYCALTADLQAIKERLTEETAQMEKIRQFDNDCVELLAFYEGLSGQIRAVDLGAIAETSSLTHTEEELAKCRLVEQELSQTGGNFKSLVETGPDMLHFATYDKRHNLEKRCNQLKESKISLQDLINGRVEALRKLVVEQQTLEGWLKKAGILIQDANALLLENEASVTLNVSRMSERIQALSVLNTKLEEYLAYSESLQGSGRAAEVARVNAEISQLCKQLTALANDFQEFKSHWNAFETEAAKTATIFARCDADHSAPASLQEAQKRLINVKVNSFCI